MSLPLEKDIFTADRILAGAGNDTIFANGGDDFINTGEGLDIVWLGAGAATVVLENSSYRLDAVSKR